MEKPTYYGILPAKIRYDERLKPMEKIMYAELTVLTYMKGYCYASNSYFAKLYKVHKNTVSLWLKNLERYGYIDIKYIMKDKQVEERRITIVSRDERKISQEEKQFIIESKSSEEKKENNIERDIFFNESLDEDIDNKEVNDMEDFDKNLVEELFGKKETILSQDETSNLEPKDAEKIEENIGNKKIEIKREETPEELEKRRKKLLKDLFGEKFEEKLKKEIEENETIEEEKYNISINKNCEGVSQKSVIDNQKMVGVSLERERGYQEKNNLPINKKIEYNNTSRIIQDYYYKKNKYIIPTYIQAEKSFKGVEYLTSYG